MRAVKKLEPGLLDYDVFYVADPISLEQFSMLISISRMKL